MDHANGIEDEENTIHFDKDTRLSRAKKLTKEPPVKTTDLKIGVIGLRGRGEHILNRLIATNHNLTVWDPDPQRTEGFAGNNITVAKEIEDLTDNSDILCWCQNDDSDESKELFLKELDYTDVLRPEKTFIDLTKSSSPAFPKKIKTKLKNRNLFYLEVRGFGSHDEEKQGLLTLYTAGDTEAYEAFLSGLQAIAKEAYHLGEEVGFPSAYCLLYQGMKGVILGGVSEIFELSKVATNTNLAKINPCFLHPLVRDYVKSLENKETLKEAGPSPEDLHCLLNNELVDKVNIAPPYILSSLDHDERIFNKN